MISESTEDRSATRSASSTSSCSSSRSSALFVGAFIIFNTFSMLVAQRTRELALLRALARPAAPGDRVRARRGGGRRTPRRASRHRRRARARDLLKAFFGDVRTGDLRRPAGPPAHDHLEPGRRDRCHRRGGDVPGPPGLADPPRCRHARRASQRRGALRLAASSAGQPSCSGSWRSLARAVTRPTWSGPLSPWGRRSPCSAGGHRGPARRPAGDPCRGGPFVLISGTVGQAGPRERAAHATADGDDGEPPA